MRLCFLVIEEKKFLLIHCLRWHYCAKRTEMSIQTVPHPSYSTDLAPCDFWLSSEVKENLRRRHCGDDGCCDKNPGNLYFRWLSFGPPVAAAAKTNTLQSEDPISQSFTDGTSEIPLYVSILIRVDVHKRRDAHSQGAEHKTPTIRKTVYHMAKKKALI